MVELYRNAVRNYKLNSQQQQNTTDTNDESGKARNAKPQDIVRLYDIIIQVKKKTFQFRKVHSFV
jgi:hypothetical protein